MSSDLSPQYEQFIAEAIRGGVFHSRGEALDQAVELLRARVELLQSIADGRRQLADGQGTAIETEAELDAFFAAVKAEGLAANRAGKTS